MANKKLRGSCFLLFVLWVPVMVSDAHARGSSRMDASSHRQDDYRKGLERAGDFLQRFGNEHKIAVPAWAEDCRKPSFAKASPEWGRRCSAHSPSLVPASGADKKGSFHFPAGGRPCFHPASGSASCK